MDFDMLKPCAQCPFRRGNEHIVTAGRAAEIGGMMLQPAGGVFPCHKTLDYSGAGEGEFDESEAAETEKTHHCAGALIFAEKHRNATQMMRIVERLGGYDAAKLMEDAATVGEVWDSLKEWKTACSRVNGKKARKALKTIAKHLEGN